MQLFTQLWPAVIEILSVVLCDSRSNEFSMAVMVSPLVLSLQVKTWRIKMTKTTREHHVDTQISPNGLIVAFSRLEEDADNSRPVNLLQSCVFFLFHLQVLLSPQILLRTLSSMYGGQTAVTILFYKKGEVCQTQYIGF